MMGDVKKFDWEAEQEKHKDLIVSLKKDRNTNDFNDTMLTLFCTRYKLSRENAMLRWQDYKEEFVNMIKNVN